MQQSLAHLLELGGLADTDIGVDVRGADPVFPSRYYIAAPGAASIAAAGVAAAALWQLKSGESQRVDVDARRAAVAMRSNHYLKIDGETPARPRDKVTGFYPTRDGRWIYLHCNFPNLRDQNLGVLGVGIDPEAVKAAAAKWDAQALEDALVAAGGCGSFVRSEEEWKQTPQYPYVCKEPLFELIRIGDAPPEPLPEGPRPLSGIRVLDLTRVLAGPTAARALAENGADVMRVSREGLADSGLFDLDTGIGKRSTYIDLREAAGVQALKDLVREGDVFSQAYRPGSLAARGFSPEDLAKIRPGIVYVSLNAWGYHGPWAGRRGYDTVVQGANGMAFHGLDQKPQFMPVSEQDYVAGYLMAYGAMLALRRRAQEGGSWHVRLSLAGVGHWIREHGLLQPAQYAGADGVPTEELNAFLMDSDSPVGRLTHLAPVAQLSKTPGGWERPAVPLGTHPPRW